MSAASITNAMSVDVEDYFQVSAFEGQINREQWDGLSHRVADNTHRILDLFDRNDVKCTFFMLGWVAERYPDLIRRIVEEGHELASHGYEHIRVTQQTPDQFRADIRKTKQLLEDMSGVEVKGYRAASYSIGEKNLWAIDELAEAGHQYSSSIYPIKHDLYGMPGAPRFAFHHEGSGLLEVPITTIKLGSKTMPCGGGGFFRFYPYAFSRWAIKQVNNRDGQAAVFYFHPWEVDPGQPRVEGAPLRSRFRHYLNLSRMAGRLEKLMGDFRWDRMDRVFLDNNPSRPHQGGDRL